MLTYIVEDGLMLGGVGEMLKPCSNCPGLSTVNQDEPTVSDRDRTIAPLWTCVAGRDIPVQNLATPGQSVRA